MKVVLFFTILILTVLLTISFSIVSEALDELFLTGKVLSYEPDTGKIKIQVLSDSCKGIREFYTEKGLSKQELVDKIIYFGIDSNHCAKNKLYRITTPLLK